MGHNLQVVKDRKLCQAGGVGIGELEPLLRHGRIDVDTRSIRHLVGEVICRCLIYSV